MLIRKAKSSDKSEILKFCKNTFSWGDYIKDVWDYWMSEKNLLVIEKKTPIGLCHAVFYKNQGWIEGIRINSKFRRQGLASKLILKVESLAFKKKIPELLMLIETKNLPSIMMAQKLGFQIYQTWNFYSLLPKKNLSHKIFLADTFPDNKFSYFVKSWRWIPLDKETTSKLISANRIVFAKKQGKKAFAILEDSEHFEKTLIVTLFSGSKINNLNIISFLQNYGYEKKYQRIQILSRETLSEFNNLEQKLSFHLMQKLLS